MNWLIITHNVLLIGLLLACIIAIELRDLLYSVITLAGASVVLAIVFYMLQAPDIAITEAAVNAGAATVLYVVAISKTQREESS
ncbi:hypothetical protein AKJ42_02485 [candidate division MSBL1 archaeon SCGC-AAA261C02]|uniref:MrpA C-terminal/MbhD domain-containing protein n=1 Tax=candidate division MSBL1 archaeon SCGC-AAA261C02 TaxID=1698272 RepID=A0A133V027_9EURY|nr:hypothetical protein AKJ42_02485 [candidate division MSBL1 archaeon SCGC-AAA261C02]